MNYLPEILDLTFGIAKANIQQGERPVAAILVLNGKIVAKSGDKVFLNSDPTAHAERIIISEYCQNNKLLHLRGFELYCFIEPCIMCCGAIHWAKIDRVIYALSQDRLKALSGGKQKPGIREYLPVGGRGIEIVGPKNEDEAYDIASQYNWMGNVI